jgi:hypothetical protein
MVFSSISSPLQRRSVRGFHEVFASAPTGHPHSLVSFRPTLNLSHFLADITSFDRPVDASVTEKKVHLRMQSSIEPMAAVASLQSQSASYGYSLYSAT